jgi:beta-galactosidase
MEINLSTQLVFPLCRGLRRFVLTITTLSLSGGVAAAAVEFDRVFAPLPGLVSAAEKPWRDELCLNGRWQFQPVATPAGWTAGKDAPPVLPEPATNGWDATPIKIPSPWNMNALDSFGASDGADYRSFPSYPAAWEKVELAWLRREFKVPKDWGDRRIVLHFEAVSGDCEVRINGKVLARNSDKFLPFDVDVTEAVRFDGPNELLVGVRAMRFFNVPGRFGQFTHPTGAWWTGENGAAGILGIWQDVYLQALPPTRVSDVLVQPLLDAGELRADVELRNDATAAREVRVEACVIPWLPSGDTNVLTAPEQRGRFGKDAVLRFSQPASGRLEPGATKTLTLACSVREELKKWTPAQPNLYGLLVEVKSGDTVLDRRMTRFGWRQFGFKDQRFTLNDEPLRLNIELCHFFGVPHLSPRHAWAWYRMLKDCNINAVRLHGAPHPRFYLELADEMGMLVHDETAIYGSHANFNLDLPVTWQRFTGETERLVRRDRNHASIFGWSVENETLAAFKIRTGDPKEHAAVGDKFIPLIQLVRRLDPTRPWISADGDSDWGGRFPVALAHYGPNAEHYRAHEKTGKPWGVTESTYLWGEMPSEASRWNGARAYESWQGRLEGMAFEVWDELVEKQIKPFPNISAVSVYDVTYYGLWPQPLGLPDLTRPLTIEDGVRFTAPFVEGQPGTQPERLGPYATMLNPGYDPALPLYQPTPVFDAARDAYATNRPAQFTRRFFEDPEAVVKPGPPPPLANVGKIQAVAFLGDPTAALFQTLNQAGVPWVAANSAAPLLVVDMGSLPDAARTNVARIEQTLQAGGSVLVWGVNPRNMATANALLPLPLRAVARPASSLLPDKNHPLAIALPPGRCYFSEASEGRDVMKFGLEGPLVEKSKVVLRAADINWQTWRDRQEPLKVAAAVRSEREAKPSGAALIEYRTGGGRLLVSSLESIAPTPAHREFFRALMMGLGVHLAEPKPVAGGLLDAGGYLTKALVLGSFKAASYEEALDKDFVGGESTLAPRSGDQLPAGPTWCELVAGDDSVLSFNPLATEPDAVNHVAYASFWLFSPRADDLLDDARGAKVDLIAGSDDGAKFWFNGQLIHENREKNPLQPEQYQLTRLSLRKGWNHFLVKVVNAGGKWQLKARLECADPGLAAQLRTAVVRPTP